MFSEMIITKSEWPSNSNNNIIYTHGRNFIWGIDIYSPHSNYNNTSGIKKIVDS